MVRGAVRHPTSPVSWLTTILCIASVLCSREGDARRITHTSYIIHSDFTTTSDAGGLVASYSTTTPAINFTHVTVDPETGRIYVGATNWLMQFNADLSLEHKVQTGPVKDSVLCSPTDCSGVDAALIRPTKNVNKVLVIDPASKMLIVCGSVHQGSCRRHRLDDIRESEMIVGAPVAANDENSSTVAFIGPARYASRGAASQVLYVGATHTRSGTYRDMVPAISSRSIESGPRLFNIVEESFSDTARVDISFHLRDYYLVKYIYGFSSGEFIYFATAQRKSHLRALEEWGYVTRLARVCSSDAGFHSYTEVTIQCSSQGVDYNLLQDAVVLKVGDNLADELRLERGSDILIGVFVASKDHTNSNAGLTSSSAICMFPLADIEQKFAENIHLCYNGSVSSRNMDYIAGGVNECPEAGKAGNVVNFCNEAVKLNGSVPLYSQPLLVYNNTTLTAITAAATGQHTVAFLGTAGGLLKKVLISSSHEADEFEEIVVDRGHPILGDIHLDHSRKFVFASSPYKVAKIKVERCFEHGNCSQCLAARNPYCGWCSLETRCTLKSECDDNGRSASSALASTGEPRSYNSPRWLSIDTAQCIDFEEIRPDHLPVAARSASVELIIAQLPPLPYGASYLCIFGSAAPIPARQTRHGLSCAVPLPDERPAIPAGADHVTVSLSVRSTVTESSFINRPFVFNDCKKHNTCRACVTSRWACNWCVHENSCTSDASLCKKVIGGEGSRSSSAALSPHSLFVKGVEYCPSFKLEKEILIPNGARREIAIEVRNLVTSVAGFECVVEIEGARERVPAQVRDGNVICAENSYTYQAEQKEISAKLEVLWNGDTFIDRTNFTLYKCSLHGSHAAKADCSLCHTADKKYQCVWCGGTCSYVDACLEPPAPSCPPPRIDLIYPLSGPLSGGTRVAIEGSNLGTSEEEIKDKIAIGGVPCLVEEYTISVRVVCRTGPSVLGAHGAVIVVGNQAGLTRAQERFQYKPVHLLDVNPKIGPKSGGTRLYISGSNLNIGSNMEVFLDELPCDVERSLASSRQISCRTSPSDQETPRRVERLTLRVDGSNFTLPYPFTYVSDPFVQRISPLESFISGGRPLLVIGGSFAALQQPKMGVFNGHGMVNESLCSVINDTLLVCPSPSVRDEAENSAPSSSSSSLARSSASAVRDVSDVQMQRELRLRVGFSMDADSTRAKELERHFPELIRYVADPKIFRFPNEGVKPYTGESLVIDGENLRLAATEAEVNVTIGTRPCNLTSLSMTQLVCSPPDVKPPETDEFGRKSDNDLPVVVVRIGSNLRYQVGYLRYEVATTYEFPPLAIALLGAAGALLLLISLIMLAVFRHKRSQAEREYKIIQLQMGTLKNAVGMECRQGGACKQTCILRPDLPPRNGNPLSTLKRNLPIKPPNYSDGESDTMNPYAASSPLESHYQAVDDRTHPYLRSVGVTDSHYHTIDDQHPYPRIMHFKQPIYGDNERMHSTTLYPRNLYEASC